MSVERAARVTDKISHSASFGKISFGLTGIVVGALVVLSGGTVAIAIAAAGLVKTAGTIVDSFSPNDASEPIIEGVEHVFVDPPCHRAANNDAARTKIDHGDAYPLTGSHCVMMENWNASRRTDFTSCGGMIVTGSEHLFIGGEPARKPEGLQERAPLAAVIIDYVYLGASVASASSAPKAAQAVGEFLLSNSGIPGANEAITAKSAFKNLNRIRRAVLGRP